MQRFLFIIIAVILCTSSVLQAQRKVKFSSADDAVKVEKGTIIEITADSAYVVSGTRASIINQKIVELDSIRVIYNKMAGNHNSLLSEVDEVQKLLSQVYKKMQQDSSMMSTQFDQVITDLDQSLINLKANNAQLKINNKNLLEETSKLKTIVKDLKKETRRIWWDGLTDKVVAFAGGVGIGVLVMAIFG